MRIRESGHADRGAGRRPADVPVGRARPRRRRAARRLRGPGGRAGGVDATRPETGAPAAVAPAGGDGTLRVWQVKLFTQSANDLSRKQITDFAQGRGGRVEVSDLPTDFIAKVIPAIEAGDVPDLIQTSSEIAQLRATGGLADVSAAVADLSGRYGATSCSSGPACTRASGGACPGSYADAWLMRRDVLAAAGLKPRPCGPGTSAARPPWRSPTPASSWGWGMTMKSNTGDGDTSARLHLDTWGATLTDESGERVILGTTNRDAAVAALEWMKETYTNPRWTRMLPPGVMGWTGSGRNNENYLGQIAITQNACPGSTGPPGARAAPTTRRPTSRRWRPGRAGGAQRRLPLLSPRPPGGPEPRPRGRDRGVHGRGGAGARAHARRRGPVLAGLPAAGRGAGGPGLRADRPRLRAASRELHRPGRLDGRLPRPDDAGRGRGREPVPARQGLRGGHRRPDQPRPGGRRIAPGRGRHLPHLQVRR